ncbi:MAG TPA: ATP-dependent DNA helicase RecG [Verrucomicrobiaceae bacterium]
MRQSYATIAKMTSTTRLNLDAPLDAVPGLPAAAIKMLEREGVNTVAALLAEFPLRHEDRSRMEFKGFAPSSEPVCHHVRVVRGRTIRFGRRSGFFEAECESAEDQPMPQQLTLRWFNMPFMNRTIAVDMELYVHGKIKEVKGRLVMGHPEYEIVRGDDADADVARIHTGRIVPVYRLRGGLKQKLLRTAVWQVLQQFDADAVHDLLPPPKPDGEFAGLRRGRALTTVHFPEEKSELDRAMRYLALEEFYVLQLRVLRRRQVWRARAGWKQPVYEGQLAQAFVQSLPFELTIAQKRSLDEIRHDMSAPEPMNRLLHGDVGSGKTVVALAAMLQAVESGHQAALMAPTQILAEQHFANARRWLEPLGVRVALHTGEKKINTEPLPLFGFGANQAQVASMLPEHLPHIIIGTHALLYDLTSLPHLGLAVIDEQHKFGVAQRTQLIAASHAPDVLVLTATPIPRTLALTVYGDLDVSTIDEKPLDRGKIMTLVRTEKKITEIAQFIRAKIEEGRQAYLVYPLIDESDKLEAKAAAAGYKEWHGLLGPHEVGLMHGRMDAAAKDETMRRFRDGHFKALVSTTVIEVGVDIPNASVMVIFNAERFGLAQLHQLRGRIGRGTHQSHCILLVPEKDDEARARLKILEETSDGFRIAEEDLRRRGPGDLLGNDQSGQAPLKFVQLLGDTRLLTLGRRLAERTLADDPGLSQQAHAELRTLLLETGAPAATLQ